MLSDKSAVVSCQQLNELLDHEELVVLMTSMKNPMTGEAESAPRGFIPGARVFDFENDICDLESALPHTMPSQAQFSEKVSSLGISNKSVIVVYDNVGIYSSARVWWMLKAMGHEQVYVLDGGLPAWREAGYRLEDFALTDVQEATFNATYIPSRISDSAIVHKAIEDPNKQILDARSEQRFYGQAAEPRQGVRCGHIPSSKSLPFTELLTPEQTLKTASELKTLFSERGVSGTEDLIFSCGSGVTACIIALAAWQCGFNSLSVYDGSWTDWGSDTSLPVSLED